MSVTLKVIVSVPVQVGEFGVVVAILLGSSAIVRWF